MKKIDKNRKGKVWKFWTKEERECLKQRKDILWLDEDGEWIKHCTGDRLSYGLAYWCKEWDALTGAELVGKLCVDNKGYHFICDKCEPIYDNPYLAIQGGRFKTARQARLLELKDKINMEN